MSKRTSFRTDIKRAIDKIGLAQTYIEDGALNSGARCLREAADLFEEAQGKRNAILGLNPDGSVKEKVDG